MRRIVSLFTLALAVMLSPSAWAEPFPTKPITFVIPYAPGGNNDVVARIVQKQIGDSLGQPILIENKPGGAAMLAGDYVARWVHAAARLQWADRVRLADLAQPAVPLGDVVHSGQLHRLGRNRLSGSAVAADQFG
jgi:hypothetical protein